MKSAHGETSAEVVQRSGSNLAFALAVLPREKRADMRVFYAFCRLADDLADDPGLSLEEKRSGLERWHEIIDGRASPRQGVEREFRDLVDKYRLDRNLLHEIVAGVAEDLRPVSFANREQLRKYCFQVASAVGLVSIEIFGYTSESTRIYAENLGYALQWTNILRDVGEDAGNGRIYLPLDELHRHGISEQDLLAKQPPREPFYRMMNAQAEVAEAYYLEAMQHLESCDEASMRSPELMRRIYTGILKKMKNDGYRVFEKRYRLSKGRMLLEFLRAKYC